MQIDVINGLLGSGKTTFLLNILEKNTGSEKVAVLVNEFGEIGIDGDLLGGQGADVVELPNGCICCTLTADLRSQIKIIAEEYKPDRLLIEPTGIATIKNLMGILNSLSLEKYIDSIRIIVVVDASTFWEIWGQNRGFVETQLQMAQIIILNKCDKVEPRESSGIAEFISEINSSAQLMLASFGQIEEEIIKVGSNTAGFNDMENKVHYHDLPLKKYEQFSTSSSSKFNLDKLRVFFQQLKSGEYGIVDRAKGIFCTTSDTWVRFDLASHDVNEITMDRALKSSKVIVIGTQLQTSLLKEDFKKCMV